MPQFIFDVSKNYIVVDNVNCENYTFKVESLDTIIAIKWDFGDQHGAPGFNTSTLTNPSHQYSGEGTNLITAIIYRPRQYPDTLLLELYHPGLSSSFSMPDYTYKCKEAQIKLDFHQPKAKYLWNTGDTTSAILVRSFGYYSLILTDSNGCSYYDTTLIINIQRNTKLNQDTFICKDGRIRLKDISSNTFKYFKWSTGETSAEIYGYPDNLYILNALDQNNCPSSDSIYIGTRFFPDIQLGRDTSLCYGDVLYFYFPFKNAHFLWQDGSDDSIYTIKKAGIYRLQAEFDGCKVTHEMKVSIIPRPKPQLGDDDSFCLFKHIDAGIAADHYLWNTGESERTIKINSPGSYNVITSVRHCKASDTINLSVKKVNIFIPNAFSPNGDQINDILQFPEEIVIREFEVFNSWGERIFHSNSSNAFWNGYYQGEACMQGVYLISVTYMDCNGRIGLKKQLIQLIQ